MTDYSQSNWAELDSDNDSVAPNGVQGGYAPSAIAPIIRAIMGAAKRNYNRSNAIYTTTGTGNAYVLTYEGAPLAYIKGEIYRIFADRANTGAATLNINGLGAKAIIMPDGSALTASQIKAGRIIEVAYNGTSFLMIGHVDQNLKLGDVSANTLVLTTALAVAEGGTGSTTAAAARTALGTDNASNLTLGTVADARLPTSMAGKTFTSLATVSAGNSIANADFLTLKPTDFATGKPQLSIKKDSTAGNWSIILWDGATTNGALNLQSGSLLHNGSTVWTSANDGSGSGLDAGLLEGQAAAYYRNASNINAGTIADARLPTSLAGKTFTSNTTIDHATTADLRFELAGILSGRLYRDVGGGLVMRRYNETTGAAEGYIQILGNGVNDAKYNGNIMWHAGNDGSGSTLDADLLDGYHASDLFRDNADFTSTGNMTLSNGAPYIRLQDTTSGSYDARVRLDANNIYFDGSSDGTNYSEVMRFEMDTKAGYMTSLFLSSSGEALRLAAPTAGQDPYISFYSGATRTTYLQYVDSGTHAGFYITNDVTDDKLGIDNSGGTSALRFWDNSRSALDVVLTSANYGSYDTNIVSGGMAGLGVGTVGTYALLIRTTEGTADTPGATVSGSLVQYTNCNGNGSGVSPPGTWRCMSYQNGGSEGRRVTIYLRIS
ncbi:hypothetical protein [Sinorhizobium meliloti]|uniref:hypothetical protein n=1 Tax=Rhizobium meliloti TaxID=382 RepID=UPI001A9DF259|nr:hypothetical protein [Sinorhizobium meliloti]